MMALTHGDRMSWFDTVWDALAAYRETCIPEGDADYDAEWDEICTAMAWISEEIGESETTDREAIDEEY